MRQLPIQPRPALDAVRPIEARTREQAAILRRREMLRRQVGITRLIQQGLTRYEAEEQYEFRIGRR